MMQGSYLFIDGGYFQEICKKIAQSVFQVEEIPLNWDNLLNKFEKAFYYDCPVPKKPNEKNEELHKAYNIRLEEQNRYLDDLRFKDKLHIFLGVTSGVGGKARQKQVDVRIAVDMLMHAYWKNMSHATLLTGDLDFKPVIDALVAMGINVTLWFHRSSANSELIGAADYKRFLNANELHRFSDNEFQKKYPVPCTRSQFGKDTEGLEILNKGTGPNGREVELYGGKGKTIIIHRDTLNAGHFHHTKHEDQDYTKRYFEDVFFKVTWDKEPSV